MTWVKARIGEYWCCGPYRIATFTEMPSRKSGFRLTFERTPIGDYSTLHEAQQAAQNDCNARYGAR